MQQKDQLEAIQTLLEKATGQYYKELNNFLVKLYVENSDPLVNDLVADLMCAIENEEVHAHLNKEKFSLQEIKNEFIPKIDNVLAQI